mmetsp:Transcript_25718/g.53582  ORF Transcript_25718/g.53582 Transcript_25718/m.53582 type:complete len:278 (+) Transcript_25718:95-928(+)
MSRTWKVLWMAILGLPFPGPKGASVLMNSTLTAAPTVTRRSCVLFGSCFQSCWCVLRGAWSLLISFTNDTNVGFDNAKNGKRPWALIFMRITTVPRTTLVLTTIMVNQAKAVTKEGPKLPTNHHQKKHPLPTPWHLAVIIAAGVRARRRNLRTMTITIISEAIRWEWIPIRIIAPLTSRGTNVELVPWTGTKHYPLTTMMTMIVATLPLWHIRMVRTNPKRRTPSRNTNQRVSYPGHLVAQLTMTRIDHRLIWCSFRMRSVKTVGKRGEGTSPPWGR